MDKNKIARALSNAKVIKFGSFKLVSGRISPFYVDLRVLPSSPESMQIISEELSKLINELEVEIVAGAETAGIPLSTAVSLRMNIPMIYVRKSPKGYGTDSMVEGIFKKGSKVVLIDDMITDGGSKMKFIDGLKKVGAKVKDIVVVLDREEGGKESLSAYGVKLHSLVTLKDVLKFMKENSLVQEDKYQEIIDYLAVQSNS